MENDKIKLTPYQEGRDSRLSSKDAKNPYKKGSDDYLRWNNGALKAERTIEKRQSIEKGRMAE